MNLKELRLESGLKQQAIASVLGISRSQLYVLEKAKYKLDKLKIEKLALIYQCTTEDIKKAWEESKNELN